MVISMPSDHVVGTIVDMALKPFGYVKLTRIKLLNHSNFDDGIVKRSLALTASSGKK